MQAVAEEVKNYQQLGHVNIALVCRMTTQAADLPDTLARHGVSAYAVTSNLHRYVGGVVCIPVHLAKGLEFDVGIAVVQTAKTTMRPHPTKPDSCM